MLIIVIKFLFLASRKSDNGKEHIWGIKFSIVGWSAKAMWSVYWNTVRLCSMLLKSKKEFCWESSFITVWSYGSKLLNIFFLRVMQIKCKKYIVKNIHEIKRLLKKKIYVCMCINMIQNILILLTLSLSSHTKLYFDWKKGL